MSDINAFNGFSKDGIKFLLELEKNNTKEWFEERKDIYRQELLLPAQSLVKALGERLQQISPDIVADTRANGAGSLMRIYRDVRFSKDKTPYKTNIGMLFWEGPRKKSENPTFGFQFGTWGAGLYAGQWVFPKDMLPVYREAIIDDRLGIELEAAIQTVEKAGDYQVEGEKYKRVPSGFDAEHPRAELLKHKGLHVSSPQLEPELLLSADLPDFLFEQCRNMAPVQQWLVRVDKRTRGL
ncbi:MAG: DUF2461 domain-containing protein [Chloroflexota bacterium]